MISTLPKHRPNYRRKCCCCCCQSMKLYFQVYKYTFYATMRSRKKMISIYWEFSVKKKEKNSNEQEEKYLSKANQGDYNKGFFRCAAARVWIFEIMCLRLTFSSAPHVLTRLFSSLFLHSSYFIDFFFTLVFLFLSHLRAPAACSSAKLQMRKLYGIE